MSELTIQTVPIMQELIELGLKAQARLDAKRAEMTPLEIEVIDEVEERFTAEFFGF